jgi:hypothetical protein
MYHLVSLVPIAAIEFSNSNEVTGSCRKDDALVFGGVMLVFVMLFLVDRARRGK